MSLDIDSLTLDELYALHDRVVERISHLEVIKARLDMMALNLGTRVTFDSKYGRQFGTVVKFNRKTVVVISEEGRKWRVSPTLLTPVKDLKESDTTPGVLKTGG